MHNVRRERAARIGPPSRARAKYASIPVAQRILGESDQITRTMRKCVAEALYKDDDATLDDLREAVTTLEDTDRIAQRVLGGAHPFTEGVVRSLRIARAALRARETPPPGGA